MGEARGHPDRSDFFSQVTHGRAIQEAAVTISYLFSRVSGTVIEIAVKLLLRAVGSSVQLPRSNEDFALY